MYKQIDANKRKTALLLVIFIAIILLIGWTFAQLTEAGDGAIILAAIIALVMALGGYYQGDKVALLTAGAKGPISQTDNPYLYRLVENLTITAGLPLPKIYLIPDPAINAFATGRDPRHASLAVTQGAVEKLKNEELEGVISHELAHIKNYDIRLMTVVIVLVGFIALLTDWFLRLNFLSGRGRSRSNDRGGGQLGAILMIAGLILLVLSPLIGKLIQLAIARKREFLADANGALLTRFPEGLARALEKIAQENLTLTKANHATAHLYIADPFGQDKKSFSAKVARLFATHPPLTERISHLRAMA